MKNYLQDVRNNNILKLSLGIQSYLLEKGHLPYGSQDGKITIRLTADGRLYTVGNREFETVEAEKDKIVDWANNERILEIGIGAQGFFPGLFSARIYSWAEIDLLLSKGSPKGTPKHKEEEIPNRKDPGGLTSEENPNQKVIPITKDLGQTIIDTGGNVLKEIKDAADKEMQQAKESQKVTSGPSRWVLIGGAIALVAALALGIKSIK